MKTWATIAKTDVGGLNFDSLLVKSADELIENLAGDTVLIKWRGDTPAEVAAIDHTVLTHEQAYDLLQTTEWYREIY